MIAKHEGRRGMTPNALTCRTVLDLRCSNDKFISQTLVLAASWHRHCADHSALEVMCVGEPDELVRSFVEDLGATYVACEPGPNDDFSASSNKIQGAGPDHAGRRVLLLDNDVCFLGRLDALASIPPGAIAASEAGNLRVSQAQWDLISGPLGLPLMRRRFHPVNARPDVPRSSRALEDAEPPDRHLYLNSGVILFPAGHDHRASWLANQRRIHELFRNHPLRNSAVNESDQAGFAASVAAHGEFAWLPLRFNYRRGCFQLGLEPLDRISIVHLTGDVPNSGQLSITERIRAYWQVFVTPRIAAAAQSIDPAEARRRTEIAAGAATALLDVVHSYRLDEWLHEFRQAREAIA